MSIVIDILKLVREIILDLIILFFMAVAVGAIFTDDFTLSQNSALIAIVFLLIRILDALCEVKKK